MLIENYYTILSKRATETGMHLDIALNENCEVYKGHFPGAPISPGVCNITMLKECTEEVAHKKLRISYIQQCRMTKLITPELYPTIEVEIMMDGNKLRGTIGKDGEIFLDLKGEIEEES